MKKVLTVLIVLMLTLSLFGCAELPSEKNEVVMTVDGVEITAEEYYCTVESRLARINNDTDYWKKHRSEWKEAAADAEEALIQLYAVYAWAIENGAQLSPEAYDEVEQAVSELTVAEDGRVYSLGGLTVDVCRRRLTVAATVDAFLTLICDSTRGIVEVTEQDMEQYAERNKLVCLKIITVPDFDAAKVILQRAVDGEDFDTLYADYSDDNVGVSSETFNVDSLGDEMLAAVDVPYGTVVPQLIENGGNYLIVKSVEPDTDEIRTRVMSQKLTEIYAERGKNAVVVRSEKLSELTPAKLDLSLLK